MITHASERSSGARSPAAPLAIEGVSKSFDGEQVLHDVTLGIEPGRCLALLGPSGSGKSTLLNLIAGFERPDRGDILVHGKSIVDVPTHRRNIGMVFQQYALFPHLSVARNVAYPLVRRGMALTERDGRVLELLETVQLGRYAHHPVQALSGGQQQRVAIARALAARPGVLLMDEPMGALDQSLREQLQIDLKLLLQEAGTTVVYVTHDQREAMALADTIAILRNGAVEQVGATEALYEQPSSAFVAAFLWTGANMFEGTVHHVGADGMLGVVAFGLPMSARWSGTGAVPTVGSRVTLVGRAEDLGVRAVAAPAQATVTTTVFAGRRRALQVRLIDGTLLNAHQSLAEPAAGPGDGVALEWRSDGLLAFPADERG